MILVAESEPARRRADDDSDELAALVVLRDGHTTHWRLARLDHDLAVDAWERGALLNGQHYAVLFSRDLAVSGL